MEFRILGPLEVAEGDVLVALGGLKQRAVLALLLLRAGETVASAWLIDEIWGEAAPTTAAKSIQLYVSQLRKALRATRPGAEHLLATRPGGYTLAVDGHDLDVDRFTRLCAEGRSALDRQEAGPAAEALRAALALWRGPALADFGAEPFAAREAVRLAELRVAALEDRIEADLALGRHRALIGELETLVAEHPLRERLRGQLMLALYRCDRQADALAAYRAARRTLVDELGLEPNPALRRLEQAILTQSAHLAPGAGAGRLPVPPNRTIGRAAEVELLAERLQVAAVRVLTLTGPGGVGKTRLALEAARRAEPGFADGARVVGLAPLKRADDVPGAIAAALGVAALPGELPGGAVRRYLGTKRVLLVLDNFEHVLDAAPLVAELAAACPAMTVLATSREPLNLQAEEVHRVAPLDGDAAVVLFAERARARDPGFVLHDDNAPAVHEICRRMDGLPLAIELAAARCGLLSADEIAARLDSALVGLGGGSRDAPERQRTLRSTIAWSHALLDAGERRAFARFAVFARGATLAGAEAVTGADLDTLERLVAKSLLVRRRQRDGATRLGMLETIRAFADERLAAAADREDVSERHFAFFLALAREHGTEQALWGERCLEHLARLDAEVDDLHAALAWAIGRADAGRALALGVALGRYWLHRGRGDALAWIEQALALPGARDHPELHVRALCLKTTMLRPMGREAEQAAAMGEAEAHARAFGEVELLCDTLCAAAGCASVLHEPARAAVLAEEALVLAQTAGDEWRVAMAAHAKAMAVLTVTDLAASVESAAVLLERVGNVSVLADHYTSAAYMALHLDAGAEARAWARRAEPIARGLDNLTLWMVVCGNLGLTAILAGDVAAARDAFREQLAICRELVVPNWAREGLMGLAAVAVREGDDVRAARLAGAADAHRRGSSEGDAMAAKFDVVFFADVRARIGQAWDAAAADGGRLGFEDAVEYALGGARTDAVRTG
jgi:predicted ATPase/DNA-binding SARP family transcriptional activator